MSELEMREAIDRLDTGLSVHPDVAGIIAGGRRRRWRRRRRARVVWGAAVLTTVAAVAQVAFIAGAHYGPSAGPGPAAAGGPTTGHTAEVTEAVTEAMPSATLLTLHETFGPDGFGATPGPVFVNEGLLLRAPMDGTWGSGLIQTYSVQGLSDLVVVSLTGDGRHDSPWCKRPRQDVPGGCHQSMADGRLVTSWDLALSRGERSWVRTVEVFAAAGNGSTVRISALATRPSLAEARAALPSVDKLTELALDERLVPPEE